MTVSTQWDRDRERERGDSGLFRDEVIVDGGLGLGFEGSGFGGNEKGYVGLGWDLGSGWEIEEAGLASSEW